MNLSYFYLLIYSLIQFANHVLSARNEKKRNKPKKRNNNLKIKQPINCVCYSPILFISRQCRNSRENLHVITRETVDVSRPGTRRLENAARDCVLLAQSR